MKSLSIRLKFALWAAALVGIALVMYSGATLKNLYDEQLGSVDLELTADGMRFAELRPMSAGMEAAAELARFESWLGYAAFDSAGKLHARSERMPEALARLALSNPKLQTARDGARVWRVGSFKGDAVTFVVGYDLEEVHQIIRDLVVAYALSLPVVVLIAALGGWWVSKRALAPVLELTLAAEKVQAGSLNRRVPVPDAKDEIQRLAVVLNAMLNRLEGSFDQAKRFAADASHELRTPLTVMWAEIDGMVRTPGRSLDDQARLVSIQEEIDRLHRITDNLLLLARFDSGRVPQQLETLDFKILVEEACQDIDLLAAAKGVRVETLELESVVVSVDPIHLRRALLNLLDNAVKFNDVGGRVTCQLVESDGKAVCTVGNTGEGIPVELRPRLFQRFFRADPSRGRSGGNGLGLSLSREIARAYGGDLALAEKSGGEWTYLVLTLPVARPDPAKSNGPA